MVALGTDAMIAIIVVVVVVVFIVFVIVLCCICRQCEICGNWCRQKSYKREDAKREQERVETRQQYDEARIEREAVRDQIRAKYNLKGGKTDVAVVS